ncbi:4-hydroxyphenylpyruvate dioxygenase-like protein [Glandiceps talaboti]
MAAAVHHVQLSVRNGLQMMRTFTNCLHFKLFAERRTERLKQWAVRSGSAVFVINERQHRGAGTTSCNVNDYSTTGVQPAKASPCISSPCPSTFAMGSSNRIQNSIFDIAFEVRDVDNAFKRARDNGAGVLHEPIDIQDMFGTVRFAAVKSNVGNVAHSLVDTSKYKGNFLPGFQLVDQMSDHNHQNPCKSLISHFDHVTYACPNGSADDILDFYEKCFGYKRFLVNRTEDVDDGFLVQGEDMGMRLKAMEYWKCAETHLCSVETQDNSNDLANVKFVIAEPLPGQGPNQVETFIANHGGPGIQHIGLHTSDIINAVSTLREEQLPLIVPPDTYYSEIGKLEEIQDVGEDVEMLKEYGILLDSEADAGDFEAQSSKHSNEKHRYLMQVFTQPIFDEDTFFLEVIQRHRAMGFGAGNITALWRSVQAYMTQQQNKKAKVSEN